MVWSIDVSTTARAELAPLRIAVGSSHPCNIERCILSATARGRGLRSSPFESPAVGEIPELRCRLQLAKDFIQPQSLDELHHIVRHALVLADAEHRHDVRVMQPRRGPRLALEPTCKPRVAGASARAAA